LRPPGVRWVFWSLSWRSDIERRKEEYASAKGPLINREARSASGPSTSFDLVNTFTQPSPNLALEFKKGETLHSFRSLYISKSYHQFHHNIPIHSLGFSQIYSIPVNSPKSLYLCLSRPIRSDRPETEDIIPYQARWIDITVSTAKFQPKYVEGQGHPSHLSWGIGNDR